MDFVKCVHLNNKYEIVSKTFSVWKQTNKGQHSQVITCICNFGRFFSVIAAWAILSNFKNCRGCVHGMSPLKDNTLY